MKTRPILHFLTLFLLLILSNACASPAPITAAATQSPTSLPPSATAIPSTESVISFTPTGIEPSPPNPSATSAYTSGQFEIVNILRGHNSQVSHIAFSPDGAMLVSGSIDRTIKLWDLVSEEEIYTLTDPDQGVYWVGMSPDGALIAAATGGQMAVYEVESGQRVATLGGHGRYMLGGSFSPDSALLATAGSDTAVKLWRVSDWQEVGELHGHTGGINSVAFSPDGALLAANSGTPDFTIRIWDIERREEIQILRGHTTDSHAIAFSPDGRWLVSGGPDRTVMLWDVESGELARTLSGYRDVIYGIAFSPRGDLIAAATGSDRRVFLWDPASGQVVDRLRGHSGEVMTVAFSPDGLFLASSGEDGEIIIWSIPH